MWWGIVVALALSACPSNKAHVARDATPRGGTLRVTIPRGISAFAQDRPGDLFEAPPLDPQEDFESVTDELFRCCLLRTLLSYPGRPTSEGGAQLTPDLATRLPTVSPDGLTWTFDIKAGIRYGPPMQGTEISASDFVTSLRRLARLGDPGLRDSFVGIRGFDDYAKAKSDAISGIETPSSHQLIFHLVKPEGDFGDLMAIPETAPIPPLPGDRTGSYGVATGHDRDGYGRFLVSTGPYMIEASDQIDFAMPPSQQRRAAGLDPGRVLHLVRNPAWSRAQDALRPAYVDRIDLTVVDDTPDVPKMATTGATDVVLDFRPPSKSLQDLAMAVHAQPALGTAYTGDRDSVRFVSMNLAAPPFDDIAVRRAVNYVIDKEAIGLALGGPFQGRAATHIAPDSLEQNALVSYDPYRTPNEQGDITLAKQQMMQSKYDRNQDGICDATVCRHILGLTGAGIPTIPAAAAVIARNLRTIGLDVDIVKLTADKLFPRIFDPRTRTPLALTLGIGAPPTVKSFFQPLVTRAGIGDFNHSLLGATPTQLSGWGYAITSVPSVEDRVGQCESLIGAAGTHCWASLDQYLMEKIVPWAPFSFGTELMIVSRRVVAFSYDQFADLPALDRIAVKPET